MSGPFDADIATSLERIANVLEKAVPVLEALVTPRGIVGTGISPEPAHLIGEREGGPVVESGVLLPVRLEDVRLLWWMLWTARENLVERDDLAVVESLREKLSEAHEYLDPTFDALEDPR